MAQRSIEINGKPYLVGCEDGQEQRLTELAAMVDEQVRSVGESVGSLGETRLILMGALLVADDLTECRLQLAASQRESSALRDEAARLEARAVAALHTAAARVEMLAPDEPLASGGRA